MGDPCGMGSGEPVRNLRGDVQELTKRKGLFHQKGAQRLSLDQFFDYILLAIGHAEVMHADNIWVVESRDGSSLPLESIATVISSRTIFTKDFDGNVAMQPRIVRAVYLSHATNAKRGPDLIRTQAGIRGQSHGVRPAYPGAIEVPEIRLCGYLGTRG